MEVKTVGIACDHAGFPLKQFVLEYLEKKGYPVKDYGTYSDASVDYPDFGHALANGIESGEGVRAGLAWCKEIAHLVRQHNDANVLVLPGRFVDNKTAEAILDEFFATTFEGGRHERRVKKIPVQQ